LFNLIISNSLSLREILIELHQSLQLLIFFCFFLLYPYFHISHSYSNTLFIIVSYILNFLSSMMFLFHKIPFKYYHSSRFCYSFVYFLIVCSLFIQVVSKYSYFLYVHFSIACIKLSVSVPKYRYFVFWIFTVKPHSLYSSIILSYTPYLHCHLLLLPSHPQIGVYRNTAPSTLLLYYDISASIGVKLSTSRS